MKPLTITEAKELAGDLSERKELQDYLKQYEKLATKKPTELTEALRKVDSMKIREEHIVKIADFLPKTAEDLQKIFTDVSLDEKETNEVLGIVTGN